MRRWTLQIPLPTSTGSIRICVAKRNKICCLRPDLCCIIMEQPVPSHPDRHHMASLVIHLQDGSGYVRFMHLIMTFNRSCLTFWGHKRNLLGSAVRLLDWLHFSSPHHVITIQSFYHFLINLFSFYHHWSQHLQFAAPTLLRLPSPTSSEIRFEAPCRSPWHRSKLTGRLGVPGGETRLPSNCCTGIVLTHIGMKNVE